MLVKKYDFKAGGGVNIFVCQKIKLVLNIDIDTPLFTDGKILIFCKVMHFFKRVRMTKIRVPNTNYIGKMSPFFFPKHIKTKLCLSFS